MQKLLTCVVDVSGDGRCTREGQHLWLVLFFGPADARDFLLRGRALFLFTLSFILWVFRRTYGRTRTQYL